MNQVYLLLGANLGDAKAQLAHALELIQQRISADYTLSSIYQSEAWGLTDQPIFYNQVVYLQTSLEALELLDKIQDIENDLGRQRLVKWGARLIDIDILYFNDDIIQQERLTVPHPYIAQRNFTLIPLVEIAPDFINPALQLSNRDMLSASLDPLSVLKS